jgi:hypothetical protein
MNEGALEENANAFLVHYIFLKTAHFGFELRPHLSQKCHFLGSRANSCFDSANNSVSEWAKYVNVCVLQASVIKFNLDSPQISSPSNVVSLFFCDRGALENLIYVK